MDAQKRTRPHLRLLLAAIAICAPAAQAVTLFTQVPVAKSAKAAPDYLVGTTAIGFDVEGMLAMAPGEVAEFSLPNGRHYEVTLDRIDRHADGDRSWVGHLAGGTQDDLVMFTLGPNGSFGSLTLPDGNWRVMPGEGHDWLFDADASQVFVERSTPTDVLVHPDQLTQARPKADPVCPTISAMPASRANIDVLFVTAPDWVSAVGAANAETRLNSLISGINTYYANSKVAIALRKVGRLDVNYPAASAQPADCSAGTDPSCDSVALDNVTNNKGVFGNVERFRRLYGADMVVFLRGPTRVSSGGASISGVAWIGGYNTTPIANSYAYMYALGGDHPAFDAKLVAHEMGHNMGNNHDPANSRDSTTAMSAVGATSYAYGYVRCGSNPGAPCPETAGFNGTGTGGFGTIMSYWLPTAPRFSNPLDTCNTNGSGNVPCSGTMTLAKPAFSVVPDEVRTLNCTRAGIAQFNTAYVPDCPNPTLDTDGDGLPDCIERALGYNPSVKDNNILGTTPEQRFLFAMQQYRDFLAREGDAGGIDYWASALNAGTSPRNQMIDQFFNSAEFQGQLAPVTRLYFAYLLRIPDYAGLQYWMGQARSGVSLQAISDAFAASPEFNSRYGALNNSQFVSLVYNNILGRAPDAAGLSYWVGQLAGGMTRGQMMVSFSESAEYQSRIGDSVYVTMIYVGMMRRSPDQAGFDYWVGYKHAGNSGIALIDAFLASAEYQKRFMP